MRTHKIAAVAFLLGAGGMAMAQDQAPEDTEAQDEFGAWVSNEAQTNAQDGGIGGTVSAEAQLQGELRGGDDDDVDDLDDVDGVEGESQGIGEAVSAAAREAAQDPDRVGGVASAVLPETRANPRAIEAVTAAGQAAVQGRAQADLARQNAQSARENAASARDQANTARENARNAAEQARAVRETVAGARGRGR